MSALDRILSGVRRAVIMEQRLERLAIGVDRLTDTVSDHEKRLVRLETMVEIARTRPLPPGE